MPLIDVISAEGSLSPEAQRQLLDTMWSTALRWEAIEANEVSASIAWAYLDERPRHHIGDERAAYKSELTPMILDADELDVTQTYKILIDTIVPRPIGWISTLSIDGVPNLAPFSFFTVVGRKPPVLSVTIQHRSDGVTLKDTYVNIRDTGEFVANLVTLPLADGMHKSAFEHPPEVDEFEAAGLEKAPSVVVQPPRVALAPVAMECKLEREFTVGDFHDHVVWGRVVRFHIRDDVFLERGRIDTAALAPIGRFAAEYTLVENVFTTPLEPAVLSQRQGARMHRLDGRPTDWSAVNQKNWSPSGSVLEK